MMNNSTTNIPNNDSGADVAPVDGGILAGQQAPRSVRAYQTPDRGMAVGEAGDDLSLTVGESRLSRALDYISPGDESLARFLARPVLLGTWAWASTTFSTVHFYPWQGFLQNSFIQSKINTFSMVRGTLHVRFVFDGTPLQSGLLQAAYYPCAMATSGAAYNRPSVVSNVYRESQLRRVDIMGNGSSAGEIVCPFIFPYPFASLISTASDTKDLGAVYIRQIVPLTSSVNAVVVPGTVQVYAWMTDVDLRVATYTNAMDREPVSRKEVKKDMNVSRIATVVSKAASMLSGVPVIGPFATAASLVSSGIASIAAAFGFSRPTDISDKSVMLPRYVGNFALTEGLDAPEKLSTDPKQGVPIGEGWLGLPGGADPMAISSIAARESYITTFQWTTSTAVGTLLYHDFIHPNFGMALQPTTSRTLSPLSYAAVPFGYWSGSVHVRFKVITSGMTRGRLIVFHMPQNSVDITTLTYDQVLTTCQNCMLDLNSSTDVEFVVRPSQTRPWLNVGANKDSNFSADSGSIRANGQIGVMVLNELSAPLASIATIVVYVRGGSDFQVAVPTLVHAAGFAWTNAMDRGTVDSSVPGDGAGGDNVAQDACELTKRPQLSIPVEPFFGERVESFRAMAKRFSYYAGRRPTYPQIGGAIARMAFQLVDDFYGFLPQTEGSTVAYWTWLTYAAMPFLALRGGVRIRALCSAVPGGNTEMDAMRYGCLRVGSNSSSPIGTYTLLSSTDIPAMNQLVANSGNGMSATSQHKQPFVEAEFPYYSNQLFSYLGSSKGPTYVHPDGVGVWGVGPVASGSIIMPFEFEIFQAAADDFSASEWIGCGTLDVSGATPVLTATFSTVG